MERRNIGDGRVGEDLRKFLKDNSDEIVKQGYTHQFTEEELIEKKDSYWKVSDKVSVLEDEKKEFMDEHKTKMKPLVDEQNELKGEIRHKNKYVKDAVCYKMFDDNNMVTVVSPDGDVIEYRPINQLDTVEMSYFNQKSIVALPYRDAV